MKKKFLALVMTLSMVLSLVPMTALAAGDGQKQETPVATEGQPAGAGANEGNQESGSNTGANNASDEDSTDTNTGENKDQNGGSGSTGGTAPSGSSTPDTGTGTESGGTSSGGTTEGGSTGTGGGTESGGTTTPQEPSNNVAKIDGTGYETLDAAIAKAEDGATIELLSNATLTFAKMSDKSITFTGNGIIKVENQTVDSYGKILTLDGSGVELDWIGSEIGSDGQGKWLMLALSGVINVRNGAKLHFEFNSTTKNTTNALYMNGNSELNVENGASVEFIGHETSTHNGQAIQLGHDSAKISVIGTKETPSNFLIDGTNRGYVSSPEIKVENSTFTVKNCTSNASNGGNFTAVNSTINFENNAALGLSTNSLNSINSTFHLNQNGYSGLVINGNSNIDGTSKVYINGNCKGYYLYGAFFCGAPTTFKSGSTLEVCKNGANGIRVFSGPRLTIGYCPTSTGSLTVEEGAKLTIKENRAYRTQSKVGDDFGGAIWSNSTVSIPKNAEIYNNHAEKAGDDIYSTGTITFGAVGNDWILDDCASIDNCNGKIYGWYDDSVGNRWNAHDKEHRHIQEYDPIEGKFKDDTVTEDSSATQAATDVPVVEIAPLALKAAHPLMFKVDYVVDGECPDGYTKPEEAYYPADSVYTVENVPSSIPGTKDGVNGTYSFTGWQTESGEFVTGQQPLTKDTTLYGKWTFTKKNSGHRPSNPTVTIPDDVPTGLDLKNHYGYIIGYPVDYYTGKPTTDQTKKPVRPEGKITRAEVATIYFRMLTDENRAANWNQVSGFSDVKSSAWYNNAISTLTKAGILKGYEDGTFQPNGYITRAEFATIAIRFFSGVYEGEDLFPDIKGHWAEDYINNAANKGLVKGYEDGTFGPDRYITRAEAVTLVNRTLNRHPHNDGLHQDMLRWPDNMDTSKWYYADMQEATNSHEPDKNKSTADKEYWGKMLPIRDWEALEKEWSNANSAPGEGEVV